MQKPLNLTEQSRCVANEPIANSAKQETHRDAVKYDFNHFTILIALASLAKDFFVLFLGAGSYETC